MGMVYGFMKALDPGSVVRESEYALAERGKGLLDTVSNYGTQLATGKKLTPQQVMNMQALAADIAVQQEKLIREHEGNYVAIAQQAGIPLNYVVPGYKGGGAAGGKPARPAGAVVPDNAPAPAAPAAAPARPTRPPGAVQPL